ncbi:hypothetical protein [Pseudooceanicola nanhaiensis]|uniref:hypothetical protein n=1 Tax=Pseudooceanicola nanhaiensis TaxID=375761 RepID=UPI00300ACD86
MSLKRRINSVEKAHGPSEPTIVFFRTFYEGRDGEVTAEVVRAYILGGPYLERGQEEDPESFKERVRTEAKHVHKASKVKDTKHG